MSRTLQNSELHYPPVEKEATAIIEAVRKWSHFLSRGHFTLITDQRSVAFMLDNRKRTKIKNSKIQTWRVELAAYSYTIKYRPGTDNVGPDTLTRAHCSSLQSCTLADIHNNLCHPGVTRLLHFVRTRNLPYSTDEVKKVCNSCRICAEIKPKFFAQQPGSLVKATQPYERLSMDFKGPLPTTSKNRYILTVIDEYSRFPFAFACTDMSTGTVIHCLIELFSLCGTPSFVHSDRGMSFMSCELKDFLSSKGIATSHSTPYHPIGNGQVERFNGIIWNAVKLALKTRDLPESQWEIVLPDALHAVRSLLSTATNTTPHERFFSFQRRSSSGASLPTWLSTPGPVMLRRFVRRSKSDPLVDEVELTHANPSYAHIRHPDGRESTVSLRDLAPCPRGTEPTKSVCEPEADSSPITTETEIADTSLSDTVAPSSQPVSPPSPSNIPNAQPAISQPRRSARSNKGVPPDYYTASF